MIQQGISAQKLRLWRERDQRKIFNFFKEANKAVGSEFTNEIEK